MGSVKVPEMPQRVEQRLWVRSLRPLAAIALRFLGRSSDASWKTASFFFTSFSLWVGVWMCMQIEVWGNDREEGNRGRKKERDWGGGWGQEGDDIAVGCRFRSVQGLDGWDWVREKSPDPLYFSWALGDVYFYIVRATLYKEHLEVICQNQRGLFGKFTCRSRKESCLSPHPKLLRAHPESC